MQITYSRQEMMAVFLARDLRDGEHLQVGYALPVAEAATRLAHIMHGPNMDLIFLGARMNVHNLDYIPMPEFGWDNRIVRWAESYSDRGHRFDRLKDWGKRVFFIGGLQVDKFGNTNLIGIGESFKKLEFRGPGSVGTPTLTTHVGRYYIILNHHSKRVLVEKCDYTSTVGWGNGDPKAREKLGLPGGGPKYCITPLCTMDFDEENKSMRLFSLHPGVEMAEVIENTGFKVIIPNNWNYTEEPSEEELEILRSRVDKAGVLRKVK